MHNVQGQQAAPLNTFSGLVTLAGPASLPSGASARNQNVRFTVGGVQTREGLASVFSYASHSAGPNAGGAAAASGSGAPWTNVDAVLTNGGQFATATLSGGGSVESTSATGASVGSGAAWSNPGNISSPSAFASVSVAPSGGGSTQYTMAASLSLTATARTTNPTVSASSQIGPGGGFPSVAASAATVYADYSVTIPDTNGNGEVDLYYSANNGATWIQVSSWTGSASGTLAIPISGISNLDTILLKAVGTANWTTAPNLYSVSASVSNIRTTVSGGGGGQPTSETLQAAISGLSVPAGATITGVKVAVSGYFSGVAPTLSVNLSTGNAVESPNLSSADQTYAMGGPSYLWNAAAWSNADLAALVASFNVQAGSGAATVYLNAIAVTVYYSQSNFATGAIDITEFSFSIAPTSTPAGFSVSVLGYASEPETVLSVQLLKAGVPVGNAESWPLAVGSASILTFGGVSDLFGASWAYSDLNNTEFGVQITAQSGDPGTVYVGYTTITAYFVPGTTNFNYIKTFEDDFGTIRTLALDATGEWWVEDVANAPGVLQPLIGGPPGGFARSFTADSREYIATSDLSQGIYVPMQYTGQWTDRVSQCGPAAAPKFSPIAASSNEFAVASITQPASHTQGYAYFLQSSGAGSTAPGNVVTIYYLDATVVSGPDADLVAAFNSGFPVFLWVQFTGGGGGIGNVNFGPQVVEVTGMNKGQPPGQPHEYYYFQFAVPSVAYNFTDESSSSNSVTYQRSLATLTASEPVPGLAISNQITVSGSSVTEWNNQWTVSQTPTSGTFEITESSVASGVATFSFTLTSGVSPTVGQLITIVGTTNDNGALNLTNATIASASGTSFTVAVSLPDATASAEQGQATTAGTVFRFDPGAALNGSTTNPIYGNGTGGNLIFASSGQQYVDQGTRKGTVFFITRNGYWTRPAPPVTFSTPANTMAIQATQIPIGPPNVIKRAIVFTEAGQDGVPGANFFTIPEPVQYVVENETFTTSSFFIDDNTSTTATLSFTDAALLSAEAVDIEGANLFNMGELPEAAWCTQYAGRTAWGRVRTNIQNFLNLSFNGGYLANPGGAVFPLGWLSNGDGYGQLRVSAEFGNSYYIQNTSSAGTNATGLISQSAFQDAYDVPIILPNTAYNVRVTARIPSGNTAGQLIVALTSNGALKDGYFDKSFSAMTSNFVTYDGTLLTGGLATVPANLLLQVWVNAMGAGADVEIDRIEIYPAEQPTNLTGVTMSYANDPEAFDLVTGGIDTTTVNTEPANGGFTLRDQFYILKESSFGYVTDSPNQEPANWNPYREVSNVAGACGIHAYDVGEEWAIMACRNGLFLFNGAAPVPIHLEIPDIWNAINWDAGDSIVVRNDVANRRIYIAAPLPTPNPWMLDETENEAPTSPNVVLTMDYQGIGSVGELMEAAPMRVTMFGSLKVTDLRRKWSLWTIPAPYAAIVKRSELDFEVMFADGIGSSKIYALTGTAGVDDGIAFTSSYCTYGFVDSEQAQMNPMLGAYNKRYLYYDLLLSGSGIADVTFYQNTLDAPFPYSVPGGVALQPHPANDLEGPLNEFSQRMFVEISIASGWFDLSRVVLAGGLDKWAQVRGV